MGMFMKSHVRVGVWRSKGFDTHLSKAEGKGRKPSQELKYIHYQVRLKCIYKLMVLSVSQVKKLLLVHFPIPRSGPYLFILFIQPSVVPEDKEQINNACSPADNNCDLGWYIARCSLGHECLGTDDIANAVTNEVHRGNGCLLRVSCDIARQEG
jgi:hypothetical protein